MLIKGLKVYVHSYGLQQCCLSSHQTKRQQILKGVNDNNNNEKKL